MIGRVLKRQTVVERWEGEMCKLMKCRIILAMGKYAVRCGMCEGFCLCVL